MKRPPRSELENKPTAVYFHYSGNEIIYVGISMNPQMRMRKGGYNSKGHWRKFITSSEIFKWFSTRTEAEQCERDLIVKFRPRFNTQRIPPLNRLSSTSVQKTTPDQGF